MVRFIPLPIQAVVNLGNFAQILQEMMIFRLVHLGQIDASLVLASELCKYFYRIISKLQNYE